MKCYANIQIYIAVRKSKMSKKNCKWELLILDVYTRSGMMLNILQTLSYLISVTFELDYLIVSFSQERGSTILNHILKIISIGSSRARI